MIPFFFFVKNTSLIIERTVTAMKIRFKLIIFIGVIIGICMYFPVVTGALALVGVTSILELGTVGLIILALLTL